MLDIDGDQELALPRHRGEVWDVAFSPDGTRLAAASADGIARLWNMESEQDLVALRHFAAVRRVVFGPEC